MNDMHKEKIIDGKKIASDLYIDLALRVQSLKANGVHPSIAVIIVGENPASKVYVGNKIKVAKELKVEENLYELPSFTTTDELLFLIHTLNDDPNIHGILVQLPLPDHIDKDKIINAIDYRKDVDGFHPITAGHFYLTGLGIIPCTALGCKLLLDTITDVSGKTVLIIGRSNIVGKPLANLLLMNNATITIAHSRTRDLEQLARGYDIIVLALGKPRFLKKEFLKEGAIVIDVGINRIEENGERILVGDADFDDVIDRVSYITPVPGGVGPMTVACVFKNLLKLIELYH